MSQFCLKLFPSFAFENQNHFKKNVCTTYDNILSRRFASSSTSSHDFLTMDFHELQDLESKAIKPVIDKACVQNELSRRLHSGDGVEKNLKNAALFLRRPAYGFQYKFKFFVRVPVH